MYYDVVVIGAGPAGSAAAFHASHCGLRVLLIDRKAFPRPKTCGDALSPRALAAVQRMGIDTLRGHQVRGARFIHEPSNCERYEDFREHPAPHVGLVIARETFDHCLLTRAVAAGAEFRVATASRLIWHDARVHGVRIETSAGANDAYAGAVVVASGSSGAAHLLGTLGLADPVGWGVAGRTYVAIDGDAGHDLELYFPIIYRERLVAGYAWVFPVGPDRVNVGVGVFRTGTTGAPSVRELVTGFVSGRAARDARFRQAVPCSPIAAAPIAVGPVLGSTPGLLVVGDLAGLANPLTGEGIAAAIESGELATQAILADVANASARYNQLLRQHYPHRFGLRPGLADMYRRPWIFMGRGWDLIADNHRTAGAALRQLVWDRPLPAPAWASLQPAVLRETVERVRAEILQAGRRLRPLLAELLSHLVVDPDARFGWYTAFGAAVRYGLDPSALGMLDTPPAAFMVLEMLSLVTVLHTDLLPVEKASGRKRTWGRNTLGLVLADTLTARALQLLYSMDACQGRSLAVAARQALRQHAQIDLAGGRPSSDLVDAETELFSAAALFAPSNTLTAQPHAVVHRLARCLATLRTGSALDAAALLITARHALVGVSESLRRPLASVLDLVTAAAGRPADRISGHSLAVSARSDWAVAAG